jgi:transposase
MHPGCDIEQVYLCREPIDFRKAINGLSVMVEQELGLNPFGSALYVEAEKFHWPKYGETSTQTVTIRELEWLLEGLDLWRNKPHKTLNYYCFS